MKIKRDTALLIAVFAAALAVVLWLMPRPNKHKYNYEENRPWGYSLLTAPFDITVYRDSATVNAMLDSIQVTKDIEPWSVVGGNPAKFIKKRVIKDA